MAFYEDREDEQQDPNQPAAVTTGGQQSMITGQSAAPAGSAGQKSDSTPDNPGNFVGINQYLQQNKAQSDKLAQNVGGFVEEQGQQAQQALEGSRSKFNEAVAQNTVQKNQQLIDEAKQNAQAVAQDEAKKAEFQKMRDAQYQGPESLYETDIFQPAGQAITKAQQAADNTQSVSGRQALLTDIQKKSGGNTSAGIASFDNALLGTSQTAKDVLGQARGKVGEIEGQLTAAEKEAADKAAAAKAETEAARQAVLAEFAGEKGQQKLLEESLKTRAEDESLKAKILAEDTITALKEGRADLTDAQLGILGINREQYNQVLRDKRFLESGSETGKAPTAASKIDLSTYAQALNPEAQISAQNIATAEDYARYQALNDLMGTDYGFLSDPSLAGQANKDALSFDFANLKQNLKQARDLAQTGNLEDIQKAAKTDPYIAAYAQYLQYTIDPTGTIDIMSPAYKAVSDVKKEVEKTAQKVRDKVSKATGYKGKWCFALDTQIELDNGSIAASDLSVGDEIFLGGKVLEFEIKDTDPAIVKEYNGVHLTEDHKVLENKKMVAVKHSEKCKPASKNVNKVVYIVTEKHVVIANDTVFSDCWQHGEE